MQGAGVGGGGGGGDGRGRELQPAVDSRCHDSLRAAASILRFFFLFAS